MKYKHVFVCLDDFVAKFHKLMYWHNRDLVKKVYKKNIISTSCFI
jgi:hypothetical protein